MAKEIIMLYTTVEVFGNTTVLRCKGRIVIGNAYAICATQYLARLTPGCLCLTWRR